ncbi:MAG TPA: HNH endonuclease family protein [Acidimicrobiales bacterium]|nr:HNH endonuclease family protein [Acidimicrobiales bacterium]
MGAKGPGVVVLAVLCVVLAIGLLVGKADDGGRDGDVVPRSTTTDAAAATSDPGSVEELLTGLAVRSSDPAADYRRAAFGDDWDYDPASGCNTREEVLIDESVIHPTVDDRCRTTNGRWRSLYDGVETDDPADLQIDHLVPLADAWRSGADAWTADRRRSFANDRISPDTLIAVTGHTNQSKGDSTPDEWLPPDEGSWCTYAEMWVRVKATWDLSVTRPEADRLGQILAAC